jgi:hypothetical protein
MDMHWIDPAALPETVGAINSLIYNADGEIDGLVLDGDRLVHVPPHMAHELGPQRLRVGAPIRVRGVKPRRAHMIVAVSITADGRCVEDDEDGPDAHEPPPAPATMAVDIVGQVRLTLHAPRGEVCGALLEDGTVVRVWPRHNEGLAEYFEPGRRIEIWGQAFRRGGMQVVDVEHVAFIAESEEAAENFADERNGFGGLASA